MTYLIGPLRFTKFIPTLLLWIIGAITVMTIKSSLTTAPLKPLLENDNFVSTQTIKHTIYIYENGFLPPYMRLILSYKTFVDET